MERLKRMTNQRKRRKPHKMKEKTKGELTGGKGRPLSSDEREVETRRKDDKVVGGRFWLEKN